MRAPRHKTFAYDSLRCLCKGLVTCPNAKIYHLPLMSTNLVPLQQPIRFILKCPEEGVICPITQESITDLSNIQDLPFDLENPDRIAMRLACQHEFSAFWLIFNWVHNNNVSCPLCRAGPHDSRLDTVRMPHHIRVSIQRHMSKLMPLKTLDGLECTDRICAVRRVIETIAGNSFMDHFQDQRVDDFIDRMQCTYIGVKSTGERIMSLSQTISRELFTRFVCWVRCDPVKYKSNFIHLDMNQHPDDFTAFIPLSMALEMLDHVMAVMYGLSLSTRYDRKAREYIYTVFSLD